MEYYTAMEKNSSLMHATMWMNLTDTALNERIQIQKGSC